MATAKLLPGSIEQGIHHALHYYEIAFD